ncbi:MAG: MarR family winged helix-turn-helix transcriptional regulator [Acidimicrobiales bacterium]
MGDRLSEDELRLWRQWFEITRRASGRFDDELQERHDLSLIDLEILQMLFDSEDRRRRMSEIAELTVVSRSRLTYRVDRLCERGLLQRAGDTTDRRGTYACLTVDGAALVEAAAPDRDRIVRSTLIDHVTDDELPAVAALLERIVGVLRA